MIRTDSSRALERDKAIALILGAVAVFWNLGSRALMGDEGQTGFMALQTLKHGVPICPLDYGLGWSVEFFGARLLVVHPWLDCYLGGLGVAIFGRTAFGLRFFFAVFGAAVIPLLYAFASRALRSRRGALICVALALGNAALLIYLRAARYYPTSLAALLAVLILWHDHDERPSVPKAVLLAVWLWILAMAFHPAGLVMNAAVLVSFLRTPRRLWIPLPGLATALFFFFALKLFGANVQNIAALSPSARVHGLIEMIVETNRHFLPLCLLPWFAPPRRGVHLLAVGFAVTYCAGLLSGSWFAVRYLVPAIPVFLVVVAATLDRMSWRWPRVVTVMLPLVVLTNLPGAILWRAADPIVRLAPWAVEALPTRAAWPDLRERFGEFGSPQLRLARSIASSHRTSTDGVVEYLREHSRPGDAIYLLELVQIYRFHFPWMDVTYSTERVKELGDRVRFVLPNRYRQSDNHAPDELRRQLIDWAEARGFRAIELDAPDVFYGNPWFDEYQFETPPASERVKIWVSPSRL